MEGRGEDGFARRGTLPRMTELARRRKLGAPLSVKQIEVLQFVAQGFSNAAIGRRLSPPVSEAYVKDCVRIIFTKLGANNRAEVVLRGAEEGYVPLHARHGGNGVSTFIRVRFLFDGPLSHNEVNELRRVFAVTTFDRQSPKRAANLPMAARLAEGVRNVVDDGKQHETGVIDTVVEVQDGLGLGAADAVTVVRHAVCSVMASDRVVSTQSGRVTR